MASYDRWMAEKPHEVRRGPLHMIAARFRLNLRCHPVDGAFRPLIDPRVSFRIPQVKYRRPGVGKADAVQRVNPHALLLEQVTDFRLGSAGRGAVSRYGKNIILALCGELCVFQKFADRLRQFPGIGRRDDAEPFAAALFFRPNRLWKPPGRSVPPQGAARHSGCCPSRKNRESCLHPFFSRCASSFRRRDTLRSE